MSAVRFILAIVIALVLAMCTWFGLIAASHFLGWQVVVAAIVVGFATLTVRATRKFVGGSNAR